MTWVCEGLCWLLCRELSVGSRHITRETRWRLS